MTKNYVPTFSIIIPAYNAEKYIKQCIESVLSQTYKNVEIIIVDDGSTDNTPTIIDNYSDQTHRTKCIHKPNGGSSDARNVGLANAVNDYVIFLDSDDYWNEPKFLENIAKILQQKTYDCVIFNSIKTNEAATSESKPRFTLRTANQPNNSIDFYVKTGIYQASACDKVVKRSVLVKNNITFTKGQLSEDIGWAGSLLKAINTTAIYDRPVYVYRQRNGSISHSINNKHISDILDQIEIGIHESSNPTILSYYAYEYSVLLSLKTSPSNPTLTRRIKKLAWLLNYDQNQKVKTVHFCYRLFGFTITRKLTSTFIAIKTNSWLKGNKS